MNIDYLRDFVAVAKNASFTKAAMQRNLSQPALSKRIGLVEKEAGCELIDRSGSPIELTAHGRVFLESAQQVLVEYDAMLQRMKDLAHSRVGEVNVVSHIGVKPVDDMIRRAVSLLKQTDPLLTVKRYNAEVSSSLSDLMEHIADVAIVSGSGKVFPGTCSYPLFEEPLRAVVRRDHPLAQFPSITPADLTGEIVWNSLSAPVARHYLAIRDILEAEGADASFHELTFHGSPYELDLIFERGVYVDGASIIAHSLPLIALETDYIAIPMKSDARLIHRMLCRADDDSPSTATFIDAMFATATNADVSLYWE